MKLKLLVASLLVCSTVAQAQTDPVVMTINGQPVSRSEFEYSYNKNNAEGVIDKKSVDEYVDLFVNYKLKVQAALDARLDTLSSFKKEFQTYRDQQIRPSFVTDENMEDEARKYYDRLKEQVGPRGLYSCSHILILTPQRTTQAQLDSAKIRIDSIYNALQHGADFAELATKVSQDPGSARRGGFLGGPFGPGNMVKPFEDMAYTLKDGEISKPFKSDFGWHIIKMKERSQIPPYDSLRTNILRFFAQREYRLQVADQNADSLAKGRNITREQLYDERTDELTAKDGDLKNLIQEYHDGLLLFEISNRLVWDKAAKDEAGLLAYFKKHKKQYKWDAPRFKGIAYHVKEQGDVDAVSDCVKKVPFKDWAERLRKTFNNEKTIRIRVEKGIFKQGDNALVDRDVFGKADAKVTPVKDFPIDATYGRKLKSPEEMDDVRGQVTADYQQELENEWVARLRSKADIKINKEVLSTVNKH